MKNLDINDLSRRQWRQITHILGKDLPNSRVLEISEEDVKNKYLADDGEHKDGNPFKVNDLRGFKVHCCNNTPCARWWIQDNGEGLIGYIQSPTENNDKNFARNLLSNMIEAYKECGVSKINLKAGYRVGAYFWAKCGAIPTKESWHRLKIEIRKKLPTVINNETIYKNSAAIKIVEEALKSDDPRKVWAISDSNIGKELLLNEHNNKLEKISLPNTTWFGQIDLDDKDSLKRLNAYLHKEKYVDKIAKQSANHKGFSR